MAKLILKEEVYKKLLEEEAETASVQITDIALQEEYNRLSKEWNEIQRQYTLKQQAYKNRFMEIQRKQIELNKSNSVEANDNAGRKEDRGNSETTN